MKKKSGKSVKSVAPAAPDEVLDADDADPGKVEKVKAEQRKAQSGKYGKQPVKPFKPATAVASSGGGAAGNDPVKEEKTSWVEVEMLDEAGEPVSGLKYEVKLPDGSVTTGTLDGNGFARIDGCDPGQCEVTFPDLDKDAWEKG